MAKKGFIKDLNNVEIMPITRGELILDSSGQLAFHSSQFLATQSLPGLMSGEDKTKLDSLEKVTVEDKKVEQVNTTTNSSYRILFSNSADDTTKTEGARKSAKLLFNPSTGALTATALIGKLNWSNLNNVPENFTPAQHIHNTSEITALTSYSKATSASDLATTDTLNVALGKLEYKADIAYTLVAGAYDGDGTIENLAEILKVLEGIKDTETIQAIVGKYLPLSGGTMSGNITFDVNRLIRWHQSDTYSISCPTGNDGAYLLLKAHNGTTIKKRLSIYKTEDSLPNTSYNLYTDGSLYAASAAFGSLHMGSNNINFKGSDPGDIAWYDKSGNETGRIYSNSGILSLRHNAGTTYKILHTGNARINNGTITIDRVSITPITSHQSLANYVTLNGDLTISGVKTFSKQLKFTVTTGSPFTVSSTTKVSNLNSDMVDGYHISTAGTTKPWSTIVTIGSDGVSEMGRYIDFHYDNTTGSDYSTRLQCGGNHSNTVTLPSATGTLALTSQIPSVGNGTVTIKLAGSTKGSFTMNQSGNTTIELTDNNTTYDLGISDYTVKINGTTKNFVRDWGHGAANMNAVARGGRSSVGMANLSTPSGGTATAVNPNGGTSWHHFINISYTDGGAGSNSWVTQIANKAGTTDLWVRSRSGGTISDTAAWTAGWTRILTGSNYTNITDGRYIKKSGDTMTGPLTISTSNWGNLLVLNRVNNGENWGPSIIFKFDGTHNGALSMQSNLLYIGDNGNVRYKAWHEGNDGSGSGLDADLLDGKHASAFALASHGVHWEGFTKRANSNASWGTLIASNGYTPLFWLDSNNNGGVAFSDYSGQTFMQIDGYFYQNEGKNRVTDITETVTALGTSGNYLTWTKNGTTNNITIPYASSAGALGNYSIQHFMTYDNGNSSYLAASFTNENFSKKAAEKYIEYWDSTGGWFNSRWGLVLAISGFHRVGSSDSYVLLGGGGHKLESNLSVNYAASAGSASSCTGNAKGLSSSGYGNSNLTYYQTDGNFFGNSGWSHYIIANHGDGSSYYNFTIGLPFWGVPIYKRLEGGTADGWHTFITSENISSLSVSYASSAGAVAWGSITGKPSTFTPSSHTHDDRYYTESEADSRFINHSGDTMTGPLTFANGTWNVVGDDAAIGDYNAAGMLGLKSINNNIPGIGFHNSSNTLLGRLQANGSNLLWNDNKIWHAGNDGSGSGLDADLLDGKHASAFATSGHNHDSSYVKYAKVAKSTADSTNAKPYIYNVENETVISGYYAYWYILNLGLYSGGNFGTLLAMPYQDSLTDSELFIRSAKSGSWRTWRRVLHDGNSSVSKSGQTLTVKINGTSQSLTNSTYNFGGVSFTSGNSGSGSHDCNAITTNGHWYYNTNGPSGIGEQSTDGALYSQAYSSSWVGQIAQDYRTGHLFTRGRNNGTWTAWKAVTYDYNTFRRFAWWANTASKKANDLRGGTTFVYTSHGAPTNGTMAAFDASDSEGYTLQLQGLYNGENLYFRNRNGDNGTWNTWRYVIHSGNIGSLSVNYAASAGNADTVDGYHASGLVKFYLSPMDSGATANSAKTWFTGTMPSSSGAIVYNVPGAEKTIIAGKSSGAFGHMLQLNYDDTYLRILRYYSGTWKSTDWEKISAGYADSAGYTTRLYANSTANLTTYPGDYSLAYSRFQADASNIFPCGNNANGVITAHLHAGEYYAQIGLSSNGRMYYRTMLALTLSSGVGWNLVAWSGESYTKSESDSRYINATGDTMTGTLYLGDSKHYLQYYTGGKYVELYNATASTGIGVWDTGEAKVFNSSGLYKIWHEGNDGSGSGLDADTVDGVHASSLSQIKYIGNTSDFCYDVILLCKRDVAHSARLDGLLFTTGGGVCRYHCADAHFWHSCWSVGSYDTQKSISNKGYDGYGFEFCTCTYGGAVWYAIKLNRIQAVSYFFMGNWDNINWTLITYYHTSQGVKNSEIYNSISNLTSTPLRYSGSIYAHHFYESSDRLLKTNIVDINSSDNIPQLKEFDWKEDGSHSYGLIAQELEEQGYSELVSGSEDGKKTVNYSAALSLIVGKLQVKIKELEKEIEILKNKN